MGFSLSNLGKKIEDVIGGAVGSAAHTVNNDVIQPINRDVVQPVVRYAPPVINNTLNPWAPVPTAIRNYALQTAGGLANSAGQIAMIGPNDVRTIIGLATHNPTAAQNAFNQAGQGVNQARQFAQFAPRAAVQLAASIPGTGQGPKSKQTFYSNNPIVTNLTGGGEIPTLQGVYKATPGGTLNKAVTTGGTGVMDLAAIAGGVKGATSKVVRLKGGGEVSAPATEGTKTPPAVEKPSVAQSSVIKLTGKPGETAPEAQTIAGQSKTLPPPSPKAETPPPPQISGRSSSAAKATPIPAKSPEAQLTHTYEDYANATTKSGRTPITKAEYNAIFKTPAELNRGSISTRPAAENTALNPIQKDIPTVAPGDYQHARIAPQEVTKPIELAQSQVLRQLGKLSKEEKADWYNLVEHPETATSPEAKEFVSRYRNMTDQIHATSQALGGNTNYIAPEVTGTGFVHHSFDLSNEADAAKFAKDFTDRSGVEARPGDFKGVDTLPRFYKDVESSGLRLKYQDNPAKAISDYAGSRINTFRRQAILKSLKEADAEEAAKTGLAKKSIDLGNGEFLRLSEKGLKEAKPYQLEPATPNRVVKGGRTVNQTLKSTLLSLGEFHANNISLLRAGPALALKGHPIAAVRGVYRTYRALGPDSFSDRITQAAVKDGMVDKAAKIGMPYGTAGYSTEGTILKHGIGEHTVFQKQIPMMHDQVARSIIHDLEKRNIPLDSPQARQAGLVGNSIMGFFNKEALNISPRVSRAMSDLLLAGQYTPSKFYLLDKAATKGGVAGGYARAAVAGNVLATAGVIGGLGYLLHQKSDDIRDMALRALLDPAVPTPLQDGKGNTLKLRLPGSDTSDIAKLLGIKLVRNPGGHLGVSWNPSNLPSTITDYMRARLGPIPGAVVKVATNTTFAGKPLYDPNASIATKAEQAGASLLTGDLPIGLQGLAYTGPVKNVAPAGVRDVLNAQTPGTNPVIKSIGSSLGLTPSTDMTVGKGQQESQYFSALDKAKQGLNRQESDAIDLFAGSKKNPVTGKYDIQPSVMDSSAKASVLLQNPKVIDHLVTLNQTLSAQGQKVDPLWLQSPDKIKAYLQYQTINKNNTQQLTVWKQNNPWNTQLEQDRSVFFNSLPPGDPNKPKNPIQPPTSTPEIDAGFTQYDKITDPTQRAQFLGQHPELTSFMDQESDYTNKILVAQGLTPLKKFPQPSADAASYTSAYMNGNKAQRAALRTGNPSGYKQMQAYLQNVDEYEVAKNGALDQLQGQVPNQALLKGISSLGNYDIVKNPDGSLALKYGSVNPGAASYGSVAAPPSSSAVSTSASGGGGGGSYSAARKIRLAGKTLRQKAHEPYLSKRSYNPKYAVPQAHKLAVSFSHTKTEKGGVRKPKVSLKRAMS